MILKTILLLLLLLLFIVFIDCPSQTGSGWYTTYKRYNMIIKAYCMLLFFSKGCWTPLVGNKMTSKYELYLTTDILKI